MGIFIITGATGAGKSLKQIEFGLEQCNNKRKSLVTNFAINERALKKYAVLKGYGWLAHMVDRKMIAYVDANHSLAELLSFPQSVVLLDEAGIFLSVLEFQKTPKKLLYDACQSRKDGVDIVAAAQFDEQIHRQFRDLAHNVIHACGLSTYDRISKRPRLIWKTYFYFDADSYRHWNTSRDRGSYVRTRFKHAFKTEHGFIGKADKLLFEIFNSFSRLDRPNQQKPLGYNYCFLPPDYYALFSRDSTGRYVTKWYREQVNSPRPLIENPRNGEIKFSYDWDGEWVLEEFKDNAWHRVGA